jgi:hypothetical protein
MKMAKKAFGKGTSSVSRFARSTFPRGEGTQRGVVASPLEKLSRSD